MSDGKKAEASRATPPQPPHVAHIMPDDIEPAADAAHIRARLEESRRDSGKFFWRVQVPLMAIAGTLCSSALLALAVMLAQGATPRTAVFVALAIWPVGVVTMIFMLNPPMARPLAWLYIGGGLFLAVVFSYLLALQLLELNRVLTARRAGEPASCEAGDGVPIDCRFTGLASAGTVLFICGGLVFIPSIWRKMRDGTRPPELLREEVVGGGQCTFAYSLGFFLRIAAEVAFGTPGVTHNTVEIVAMSLSMCECYAAAVVLGLFPSMHERVQDMLVARGAVFGTATGIAALMQGREPEDVHALALSRFRAVRAKDVTLEAFASNASDASLHEKTIPCVPGRVDAFVSHSWWDDPKAKFDALQAWRTRFRQTFRREPLVWLDKYCIEQSDSGIADGLVCLPVFLSGCHELLILCGSTWVFRLWPVVEVCCWAQMRGASQRWHDGIELIELERKPGPAAAPGGGSMRHAGSARSGSMRSSSGRGPLGSGAGVVSDSVLTILQQQHATPSRPRRGMRAFAEHATNAEGGAQARDPEGGAASLDEQLAAFDVRDASSSLAADYERLIAVIEAISGDLDAFNQVLSSGLRVALDRSRAGSGPAPPSLRTQFTPTNSSLDLPNWKHKLMSFSLRSSGSGSKIVPSAAGENDGMDRHSRARCHTDDGLSPALPSRVGAADKSGDSGASPSACTRCSPQRTTF